MVLWGEREVWCVFWFCDSLCSQGDQFLLLALFLLFTIQHPGDMALQVTSLPPEVMSLRPPSLLPLTSQSFSSFPWCPSIRLCFQYFHIQEGMLLLEVVFICSATRSRCDYQTLSSGTVSATFTCSFLPCAPAEASCLLHLLVTL